MKIFEFLYYCIYCAILLIKDIKEKQEKAAYELLYIPLIFNTLMIFFPLMKIFQESLVKLNISRIESILFMGLIVVIWSFFCRYYFIKRENYIRIINHYQHRIKNRNAAIIGVLYILVSFILFVVSAKFSSRIEWHF